MYNEGIISLSFVESSIVSISGLFFIKRNKSERKTLNIIGPRIDPCGTPDKSFAHEKLFTLLTRGRLLRK